MPTYKLTYFNGRGRAEVIRLVFAAGGQDYVDHRIERDQWPNHKAEAPFGQLPLLEVDGVKLCQSNACARYVARQLHLAGKTDLEQAQADMLVDCYEDALKPILQFFFEKDEAKKKQRPRRSTQMSSCPATSLTWKPYLKQTTEETNSLWEVI